MNQLKPQPEDEQIPAPDKDMFYRRFESSSEVLLLIEPASEQVAAERIRALHEERNYFIFPHHLPGGEERIVEVYSSPIELQGVRFLFSTIHDITRNGPADTVIWVRSS